MSPISWKVASFFAIFKAKLCNSLFKSKYHSKFPDLGILEGLANNMTFWRWRRRPWRGLGARKPVRLSYYGEDFGEPSTMGAINCAHYRIAFRSWYCQAWYWSLPGDFVFPIWRVTQRSHSCSAGHIVPSACWAPINVPGTRPGQWSQAPCDGLSAIEP